MPFDAKRVESIYRAAVAAADSAIRQAVLSRECGSDHELRNHVESMLANQNASKAPNTLIEQDFTLNNQDVNSDKGDLDNTVQQINDSPGYEDSGLPFLMPSTVPGALGRLGHYDVMEVLGRGGFGIVMKAFDNVLHRIVAIKMMSAQLAVTSPARKRFLREARAAAAVRHDNVVQIYAVEEQPIPYLVMEYIPGETLQQLLDRTGPLELKDVLRIGSQIARGLAAAHDISIIHRDIKPANILIEKGPEGRARLTDFGLARAADDASLTQSGAVAGTPMYMSPEQARGEQIDTRADLFCLGSVLYVMISGHPPFRAATALAVLQRVNEDTPRSIQESIPETPRWLCDLVSKLHEKDPNLRIQTSPEVADILTDCLNQLKQHGTLTSPPRMATTNQLRTRQESAKATHWSKWAVPALMLVMLLAITITELIGITHLFRNKSGITASVNEVTGVTHDGTGSKKFTNSFGMQFSLIPKGNAWLGGANGTPGTKEFTNPQDFFLGVYEVTQGEWESVMGKENNPSKYSRQGEESASVADISDEELKRFPIESVSWEGCQEFIRQLNDKTRESGWLYRLPTSLEWEYACRGGPMQSRDDSGYDYYFDNKTFTLPVDKANFKDSNLKRPRKVGSYAPNRLGLYDMHGNVFEYCGDVVISDGESVRPLRGGAFLDDSALCRAGKTNLGSPAAAYHGGGLRLARVPVK